MYSSSITRSEQGLAPGLGLWPVVVEVGGGCPDTLLLLIFDFIVLVVVVVAVVVAVVVVSVRNVTLHPMVNILKYTHSACIREGNVDVNDDVLSGLVPRPVVVVVVAVARA